MEKIKKKTRPPKNYSVKDDRLTFGAHKGKPLKHVPVSYLNWLLNDFRRLDSIGYRTVNDSLAVRGLLDEDSTPKKYGEIKEPEPVEVPQRSATELEGINEIRRELGLPEFAK